MEKRFDDWVKLELQFIRNMEPGLMPVRQKGYKRALAEQEKQILELSLIERELLRIEIRNDCKKIKGEIKDTEDAYLAMRRSTNWVALIVALVGAIAVGIMISGCLWLLLLLPFYVVVYIITDCMYAKHLASKMYDFFYSYGYLEGSEFLADWRGLSAHTIDNLPDL